MYPIDIIAEQMNTIQQGLKGQTIKEATWEMLENEHSETYMGTDDNLHDSFMDYVDQRAEESELIANFI